MAALPSGQPCRGRLGRIFPYCLPEHLFFGPGASCRRACPLFDAFTTVV